MAFSNTKNKESYVATEGQTTFQVTFQVYTVNELDVYVNSLLVTSGYSVMLPADPSRVDNNEYGQVVFETGLAVDTKVLLYRSPDMTQVEKMALNGPFPSSVVERALDRIAQVNVAQAEKLGRAISLPIDSMVSDITVSEPEANKALVWSADGTRLVPGPTADEVAGAQGYAETAQGAAVNAAGSSESAEISAQQAADFVASVNLPDLDAGDAKKALFVKDTEDGYELLGIKRGLATDLTVTVGTGGDFATINEALAALDAVYYPLYVNGGFTAEISLLTGFVMEEQVAVYNKDLSWITITSVDATVTVSRSAITTLIGRAPRYPVFYVYHGALPAIGTVFDMDTSGIDLGTYNGVYLEANSKQIFIEGAGGFTGVSGDAIYVVDCCVFIGIDCNFSDAEDVGVKCTQASFAQLYQSVIADCGTYGVTSESGSSVVASSVNGSGAGMYGFRVNQGGILIAIGGTGTLSQTADTWAANGFIRN